MGPTFVAIPRREDRTDDRMDDKNRMLKIDFKNRLLKINIETEFFLSNDPFQQATAGPKDWCLGHKISETDSMGTIHPRSSAKAILASLQRRLMG